jgi:hypothetical protein
MITPDTDQDLHQDTNTQTITTLKDEETVSSVQITIPGSSLFTR